MTNNQQLPCDNDGFCMLCKEKPSDAEKLTCKTCVTPWHVTCLSVPLESMSSALEWSCPDCSDTGDTVAPAVETAAGELIAAIRAIEADSSITEQEKAKRRQKLMSGKSESRDMDEAKDDNEILAILGDNIKCSFCMQLPDRPVTTPCGHNFCLKCFEKWVRQGKKTCAKCRKQIPPKMASQPRINSSLVYAIRMARTSKTTKVEAPRVLQYMHNEALPEEAFTTDKAVKSGKANAKSGRIFVTIPNDQMGPITEEYDPIRKTGVLVGDSWEDRLACRQWGAHFPHVSGIAGQSNYGAQSVVLSGGYQDDEDHGEWFLYTGSGGRDLSGNKRTNKEQSSDQKFTLANQALRISCEKGYPVRVVRSFKEKRSNYAPEEGVRYDGIYRIEKCWRKDGQQGFLVCRYLFVRCDNSPAPWTSDDHGDRIRPLPKVPELKHAIDLTERKESPHWDFDVNEGCWKWNKSPPPSKAKEKCPGTYQTTNDSEAKIIVGFACVKRPAKIQTKNDSKAKIMKEFSCLLCRKVLNLPITTPCAHNFCKSCLDGAFEGQTFVRERKPGGRQLRTQKNVMKCPSCTMDISEFLQNAQVNRELMGVIESLMSKFEEGENAADGGEEGSGTINDNEDIASDAKNSISDSDETEIKPLKEETDKSTEKSQNENNNPSEAITKDGEDNPESSAVTAKQGLKRKNATKADVTKTRGKKIKIGADDGNDSPSSPLNVGSDNEHV